MKRATILALFLIGCGDDGGSTVKDAAPPRNDGPLTDGRLVDAPKVTMDGPPGTTPLIVRNVLNWCSVKVNGASMGSPAGIITTHVTPGVIPITATALGGFKIVPNMWHLTDGDTGGGETGVVTGSDPATAESAVEATVVANMPKCVWLCCPFLDGHGCEPTATDPLDCP